ncbi:MAG: PrpR N-terminal domain-containing protein [Lachnospiraceae bacterium]|nr:PrpR N-terminal domain-containing protein [Lachnospiraceae bacterium]
MARIGMLFPEQQMVTYGREAAKEAGLDVVYCGEITTADSVNEARAAVALGAEILIARGYQALLIKEYMNVPIVELRLTAQEIGLLLQQAKKLSTRRRPHIAIIGFANLLPDTSYMEQLFDVRLSVFFIEHGEDTASVLERMEEDRPDVVIGGMATCEAARQQGYTTVFYKSTNESILAAIQTAQRMSEALDTQKQSEVQMETVLDTSFNGIIRVNREGEIIVVNRIVENLIGKSNEEIQGKKLTGVLPQFDGDQIEQILSGETEQISTSIYIRNDAWMVLVSPIRIEESITGAIISFRRSSDISYYNRRTEKEMLLSGFVTNVTFADIETESPLMKQMLEDARAFSLSDRPISIQAADGMDPGRIAKAIHHNSSSTAGPFVSLDLQSVPEQEQMDVLFRRNLQGAENSRGTAGAILQANHGTVFLKGIEYLILPVQHQVARMLLPARMINTDAQRLDSANARLIVSSKKELKLLLQEGKLDPEFFYLVNALVLRYPTLNERKEDIRKLFEGYLRAYMKKYNKNMRLTSGGIDKLCELPWPGNELQMEIFTERLVLSARKRQIDEIVLQKLYDELYPAVKKVDGAPRLVIYRSEEGDRIRELLGKYAGNRQAVAEELGISTTTLWRHMKKYGIESYR